MSVNARKFCQAAIDGDNETVNRLLNKTNITPWVNDQVPLAALQNQNFPPDSFFVTPLNIAVSYSSLDVVKELVDSGAGVWEVDGWKFTALHAACNTDLDYFAKCEFFLDRYPDLMDTREAKQDAALHRAALHGYANVIALFVARGADVNAPGWLKRAPVINAAAEGHISCIDELVKGGANIEARDVEGATCLHMAAMFGHAQCVKHLIDTHNADVKARTRKQTTPHMLAEAGGHLETMRILSVYTSFRKSEVPTDKGPYVEEVD